VSPVENKKKIFSGFLLSMSGSRPSISGQIKILQFWSKDFEIHPVR